MSLWLLLIPASILMLSQSYISYSPAIKAKAWFPFLAVSFSTTSGLVWMWASRSAACERTLYSFACCWDMVAVFAFGVLPLIACGVRLSPTAMAGVVLMVLGTCLVKWG